jgi:serine/threonine protein kinase
MGNKAVTHRHDGEENTSSTNNISSISSDPISSDLSGASTPIPSLHGSLMRQQHHRDPHRFYETITILGDGSMGSVSKVIKHNDVAGGSARAEFVLKKKQDERCFGIMGSLHFWPCPTNAIEETRDILEAIKNEQHRQEVDEETSVNEQNSATSGNSPKKLILKHQASASSMITYGHKEMAYALKSIHLEKVKDDQLLKAELRNEISILQRLDHPNIVKAIETFDFKNRLYLVLELCSGGDLYTRDPYTEAQACAITSSILDAVAYMHKRGIIQRDLKFENIMVRQKAGLFRTR